MLYPYSGLGRQRGATSHCDETQEKCDGYTRNGFERHSHNISTFIINSFVQGVGYNSHGRFRDAGRPKESVSILKENITFFPCLSVSKMKKVDGVHAHKPTHVVCGTYVPKGKEDWGGLLASHCCQICMGAHHTQHSTSISNCVRRSTCFLGVTLIFSYSKRRK